MVDKKFKIHLDECGDVKEVYLNGNKIEGVSKFELQNSRYGFNTEQKVILEFDFVNGLELTSEITR